MTYGNSVRDDSQQLRDIQDIIARLNDVNRKLSVPIRTVSLTPADAGTVVETPVIAMEFAEALPKV